MKRERKVWAMTLIALWWLAPNKSTGQQDSVRVLDEVVVTATKFPKSRVETGKVLIVIDEDLLAKSQGKDLSQLLGEQAGIILNGANSNPGKDKSIFLRGAGSAYTLILLDGIPAADPSGVGGAFDPRMLPISQIERIEILKGSQSTLYGSDAMAGVINIITKKKGNRPIGANGSVNYGSYNTLRGNAALAGSQGIFDYHIGYTHIQTNGISEAKDTLQTGGFDKDGYQQQAVQATLGIKPSNKLSIKPFIRYNDFDGKYDKDAFLDNKKAAFKSTFLNWGANMHYQLNKGTITLMEGYNKTDRTFDNQYDTTNFKGRFNHLEIFYNTDISNHLQLLSGISQQHLSILDESGTKKNPSLDMLSPYLSFFVKNMGGFSAEMGGRFNLHSVYGNNFTYSLNPSYLVRKKLKVFANISTAFKTPTLSQLYGPYGANENLKPEEANSLEGGLHFVQPNKKWDVRATGFSRQVKNVMAYTTGYINLNRQNDHGFELEPSVSIGKVSIKGFYAFVDGKISTETFLKKDTTYNNLLRRPKHSFGSTVACQLNKNIYASLQLQSFGKRNDIYYDPNTYERFDKKLDAYQLVNVYVEYKIPGDKLKFYLDVKNLLNQDYMEVSGYNVMRFNCNTGIVFDF